jgi:N-methylhydantoinase A
MGDAPNVKAVKAGKGTANASAAVIEDKHTIWSDGKSHKAKIYDRSKLKAGNKIPGPAVVTEFDSTTVILADCQGEVDKVGCILITPKGWKGNKAKPKAKAKKKAASKSKAKK